MSGSIRKILLAADFSEPAERAAEWARSLASMHGASLVVVHAHQPLGPMMIGAGVMPVPDQVQADLREAAAQRLAAFSAELADAGCPNSTEVRGGLPGSEIAAAALELSADLIVIGTRGQTGMRRRHLGHTVSHLLRETSCPMFVVHPDDAGEPRSIRTVLVPTDFSEDAARATQAALRVLDPVRGSGAHIELVHAYHVPNEFRALLGPDHTLAESVHSVEQNAQQELERIADRIREHGVEVGIRICEGRVHDAIEREAERIGADLIAMATHVHGGFRELLTRHTAERVLPQAPCPVLTVRSADLP